MSQAKKSYAERKIVDYKKDLTSRGWIFVLNNYTDENIEKLQWIAKEDKSLRYFVWGEEVGDSGTPHLQGFAYWKSAKTWSAVNKWFGIGLHTEPMYSNAKACSDYCKEDDTGIFEIGVCPMTQEEKGKAGDEVYKDMIELAKGGDLTAIETTYPGMFIRYKRTLYELKNEFRKTPDNLERPCGMWVQGKAGTGKSTFAQGLSGSEPFYLKSNNKWWCNYNDEKFVVIEDMDTDNCPGTLRNIKLWLDKWPFQAEFKGGMKLIRPEWVIITSNYSMEEVFGKDQRVLDPLMRRMAGRVFKDFSREKIVAYMKIIRDSREYEHKEYEAPVESHEQYMARWNELPSVRWNREN